MKKYLYLAVCLIVFLTVSPCRAALDDSVGQRASLAVDIQTDKVQYAPGECVLVSFTVINTGSEPVVLNFSSGRQVDFSVVDMSGIEVWRSSRHALYIQALTSMELQPGEVEEFQEEWPQVNNSGEQVSPGIYQVIGQLTANGIQHQRNASIPVAITPSSYVGN
ncbi:MAG: BsuPI-related putative proteinase inhibitor [bacterium]